jgi:hypothetical protein
MQVQRRATPCGRPEAREELCGELIQVVGEHVDGCAAGDEQGADPQRVLASTDA